MSLGRARSVCPKTDVECAYGRKTLTSGLGGVWQICGTGTAREICRGKCCAHAWKGDSPVIYERPIADVRSHCVNTGGGCAISMRASGGRIEHSFWKLGVRRRARRRVGWVRERRCSKHVARSDPRGAEVAKRATAHELRHRSRAVARGPRMGPPAAGERCDDHGPGLRLLNRLTGAAYPRTPGALRLPRGTRSHALLVAEMARWPASSRGPSRPKVCT